jgi:hypothetical protein
MLRPSPLRMHTAPPLCAPAAGSRYLSSDISYFGVGSKNAAFYLGRTVKVVTKTSDSAYVHELCIQGERQRLNIGASAIVDTALQHSDNPASWHRPCGAHGQQHAFLCWA